jgi:hypothetical protein
MAWPEIVGERLAGVCEPVSLEWPRGAMASKADAPASEADLGPRGRRTATLGSRRPGKGAGDDRTAASLIVRVEGAFGLEVQHLAPAILERVNAYFGWRCADRLVVRQGRVSRKTRTNPPSSTPDPKALAKAREAAAGIADDALRESLLRLGALVLTKR